MRVLPANGAKCAFDLGLDPAGKKKLCPKKATMKLDGVPLCHTHAEIAMAAECGRNVKIDRK